MKEYRIQKSPYTSGYYYLQRNDKIFFELIDNWITVERGWDIEHLKCKIGKEWNYGEIIHVCTL